MFCYLTTRCTLLVLTLLSFSVFPKPGSADTALSKPVRATTLHIAEALWQKSGLRMTQLKAAEYQPEQIAFGQAIDLLPLLAIRDQYVTAQTNLSSTEANYSQAQQDMTRLRELYRNEVVSTRKLQKHQSQWLVSGAQYHVNRYRLESLKNSALLQWGPTLSSWIFDTHSTQFSNVLQQQKTLLTIDLPSGQNRTEMAKGIYVHPAGLRQHAYPAALVSPSPKIDSNTQNKRYFYICQKFFPSGTRVIAWLPQQHVLSGVMIPASSIVWRLGQAYVYIQTENDQFARRPITNPINTGTGYFIQNGLSRGEHLVTSGAQMLLSEEFRGQIPDENDDDDDD